MKGTINYGGLNLEKTNAFWYDREDVATVTLPQGKIVFSACGKKYFLYQGNHVSATELFSLLNIKTDEDVENLLKNSVFKVEDIDWVKYVFWNQNGDCIEDFTSNCTSDFIDAIYDVIHYVHSIGPDAVFE